MQQQVIEVQQGPAVAVGLEGFIAGVDGGHLLGVERDVAAQAAEESLLRQLSGALVRGDSDAVARLLYPPAAQDVHAEAPGATAL